MYNTNMLPCRQIFVCSLILIIRFLFVRSITSSTKLNITLKTPGKTSSLTKTTHKSIHVKYTLSHQEKQWSIVGFELQLQSHRKIIEQLTVHLCDSFIGQSIWYDDKTVCDNEQSMLIYEWIQYSSLAPFRLPDDCGFQLNKTKSIILTIVYKKERSLHKEQSGIIIYISTQSLKFRMGTMIVGNQQIGTSFSCRSLTFPRVFYGIKKLFTLKDISWWRIYIIRTRQFRRKLIESVFNSELILNKNQNNINIVSSDVFLMNGDYLLIECDNHSHTNCYFLIYYAYKLNINENNICQSNEFPNLFKFLPSRKLFHNNQTITHTSNMNGSKIFLIICIVLFSLWISTIIGCIIMRRIRGLVNYRTEPSSPSAKQKNRFLAHGIRNAHDQFNQRTGDADHIIQTEGEHAGHIG